MSGVWVMRWWYGVIFLVAVQGIADPPDDGWWRPQPFATVVLTAVAIAAFMGMIDPMFFHRKRR